jgi:predicted nucleotidyltransferase
MSFEKVRSIAKQFREIIEKKYEILDIKLFGSSARGDFSDSSDIDIMYSYRLLTERSKKNFLI